ncbi:hypothetical protein B0I21_101556 [Sphingobacterium paludis]|jgi:hypothetical protein|uniref:Uncharacterized protein n=1 Tax=Sphingobacterium paludis TaxID=1476465 RepID=A0A4R7DBX3_9SPHI|nr:hypothetical protein B0I21_101556 [Sphingobacterium paludis]
MLQYLRNTFFVQLLSTFLLALLALKTSGLLFSVFPDKNCIISSMPIDADASETDESHEIKKTTGKLICLLSDYFQSTPIKERSIALLRKNSSILFTSAHFDSIPSPPPDC